MDEYDEIARRFFNEFLELKVQLDTGRLTRPKNYEKELGQYKRAAEQFKKAAQDMANENSRLQNEIADLEEQVAKEKAQKNEAMIALHAAQEKLEGLGVVRKEQERTGYSFVEHMSEESRRAWESLMRAPGSTKDR